MDIFVVVGETGDTDFETYRTWLVAAYFDEPQARACALAATNIATTWHGADYVPEGANFLDPHMEMDQRTGTRYSIERVPMKGTA